MSKGSNRRPRQCPREKYDANWDEVFGKKKDTVIEIPANAVPFTQNGELKFFVPHEPDEEEYESVRGPIGNSAGVDDGEDL